METETKFATIYDRFLGKITDDMYVELTPEDTLRDLHTLLLQAIPGFEFPRKNLYDFVEDVKVINKSEMADDDYLLAIVWDELPEGNEREGKVIVDGSHFNESLTEEEINILAILMMNAWLQRQITSIENIRMKYSGSDFKMTSQANHLAKLLTLRAETERQSMHMQRLYKRRKTEDGYIKSNWSILRKYSALNDDEV